MYQPCNCSGTISSIGICYISKVKLIIITKGSYINSNNCYAGNMS